MNKLQWGIVALILILTGVTVYSFAQITTLQTLVTSLNHQISLKNQTLVDKTVKIGYISSTTQNLATVKPFLEKIIIPDMNAYCNQIGRNVTFQFQIEDAQGSAEKHNVKVQQFKEQGISVFIGGLWSSHASVSLSKININHMLMLSYGSTSPTLLIKDRLFRMCPSDVYTPKALVDMLWSYDIRHVCVIQRGDSWADITRESFKALWEEKGEKFTGEPIRYEAEETDFSSYLDIAEKQISDTDGYDDFFNLYNPERIAILLLSFNEAESIISLAKDYPKLSDTQWFWADMTLKYGATLGLSPDQATNMRVFSMLPPVSVNRQYQELESRYKTLTGLPLELNDAYLYDSAMILMKAMLQADSSEADDIMDLLQPLCNNYYGVSGSCSLNEFGDRIPPPYDIWGYRVVEGNVVYDQFGRVDPITGDVSWYILWDTQPR